MKTLKIEGRLLAKSPIHSGGDEKTGSETMLRRLKFLVNGKIMEIPYISGNSIRGNLRRLAIQDMLDRLGYEIKNLKLYHAFFSGGVLETVEESGFIDLEIRKRVRELLPPLSVFGFAYKNQVFEGKLIVGHALPICKELAPLLEINANISIYELLDWDFATRKEEIKEGKKNKDEPKVQMIYRYEVFIPGTIFYHYFVLQDTTKLEESFFSHLLRLWQKRPFIGGRSSTGLGKVDLHYKHNLPDPNSYIKFLSDKKDEIVSLIAEMEKM